MLVETEDVVGQPQLSCFPQCPHCALSRPQILLVHNPDPVRALDGTGATGWAAYRCTSCAGWILVRGYTGFEGRYPIVTQVFPGFKQAHEDLPQSAKVYLNQAMQTLASPDASAVMSGSAVDAMLKAMGYVKGSVYERIDEALVDHKITENMAQWAHSVRLEANRPRHSDSEKAHLSADEARQSLEFAEALGNFLFVLTARIERGIIAATSITR